MISATTSTAHTAFRQASAGHFTAQQICNTARAGRDARKAMMATHLAILKSLGDAAAHGTREARLAVAARWVAMSEQFKGDGR
jgi:hypothetical protein